MPPWASAGDIIGATCQSTDDSKTAALLGTPPHHGQWHGNPVLELPAQLAGSSTGELFPSLCSSLLYPAGWMRGPDDSLFLVPPSPTWAASWPHLLMWAPLEGRAILFIENLTH